MPPTHQLMASYLETIDRLEQLPVKLALPCHWNPMEGPAFRALLRESRDVLFRDLATVQQAVRRREPISFEALVAVLNDHWAAWPEAERPHYSYALAGYLEYLENAGTVRIEADGKAASA
jgi:hypothetical protein